MIVNTVILRVLLKVCSSHLIEILVFLKFYKTVPIFHLTLLKYGLFYIMIAHRSQMLSMC